MSIFEIALITATISIILFMFGLSINSDKKSYPFANRGIDMKSYSNNKSPFEKKQAELDLRMKIELKNYINGVNQDYVWPTASCTTTDDIDWQEQKIYTRIETYEENDSWSASRRKNTPKQTTCKYCGSGLNSQDRNCVRCGAPIGDK